MSSTIYKLPLNKLNVLFNEISSFTNLYRPAKEGGVCAFSKYDGQNKFNENYVNSDRPPKYFFFPQNENLYEFILSGKSIEIINPSEDNDSFALFGVRACDFKSFLILDKVFLDEPVDKYYKARRENSVIITLACSFKSENCFCENFKIDPVNPDGDISSYIDSGHIYFKINTEKGRGFFSKIKNIFTVSDRRELEIAKQNIKENLKKYPSVKFSLDYWENKSENEILNSPLWEKLEKGCLGCGSCAFGCPTCQCYDIREYEANGKTSQYRCWDSCMYSDFTRMAGGNPRKTGTERFRQRFMHKLKYFPENNDGLYSCVGCGRCLKICPARKNILKVIESFNKNYD